MSKICSNCGAEFDEELQVCPNCEALVDNEAIINQPQEDVLVENEKSTDVNLADALAAAKQAGETKRIKQEHDGEETEEFDLDDELDVPKSKLPMIVGVTILFFLLIAIGVVTYLYKNNNVAGKYEKLVATYLQSYQDKDMDMMLSTYPEFRRKDFTAQSSADELWKSVDESFKANYGDDWKSTYTLGTAEAISAKDLTAMTKDINESYKTNYKVTSGYWVYATMSIKGSKGNIDIPMVFAVGEINGEWSILIDTINTNAYSGAQDSGADSTVQSATE